MESKTKKPAVPKLFFMITCVLTVTAILIQTVLFINYYDENLNLYKTEITGIPKIFYMAIFISSLFCAASYFAINENERTKILPTTDRFVVFASILSGFQLSAAVLFNIYYYLTRIYTGITLLRIAVLITAVPAAAYFIVTAFARRPKEKALIICGFFTIIWAALYLMCVYFDMSSPLNSPVRILEQLSLIIIMLYFVFEVRFLLLKPRPRLYLPVSLLSVLFIYLSSVPDLILTFAGFRASTQDTVFGITQAAVAIYITARVRSFIMDT